MSDETTTGTLESPADWDRPDAPGMSALEGPLTAVEVLNDNHLSNLMADAADRGVKLLPAGAGRGGPLHGGHFDMVLDMRRQSRILDWDGESLVVKVEAGVTVGQLAEHLAQGGASLAGWRREHPECTIGGLLSAWRPVGHALWNGTVREACIGLSAVTGAGDLYEYVPAPRKAAGPDLRYLFIGGEGAFGVICAALLGVSAAAEVSRGLSVAAPEPERAFELLKQAQRAGLRAPNMLYSPAGGEIHVLLEGAGAYVEVMAGVLQGAAAQLDLEVSALAPEDYYDPARGDLRAGADPIAGRPEQGQRAVAIWGSLTSLAALPDEVLNEGVVYDISTYHAALHVPTDVSAELELSGLGGSRAFWLEGADVQAPDPAAAAATRAAVEATKAALDPSSILPAPRLWTAGGDA